MRTTRAAMPTAKTARPATTACQGSVATRTRQPTRPSTWSACGQRRCSGPGVRARRWRPRSTAARRTTRSRSRRAGRWSGRAPDRPADRELGTVRHAVARVHARRGAAAGRPRVPSPAWCGRRLPPGPAARRAHRRPPRSGPASRASRRLRPRPCPAARRCSPPEPSGPSTASSATATTAYSTTRCRARAGSRAGSSSRVADLLAQRGDPRVAGEREEQQAGRLEDAVDAAVAGAVGQVRRSTAGVEATITATDDRERHERDGQQHPRHAGGLRDAAQC